MFCRLLKFIFFLAIGILLLWFAFRSVDFSKLVAELKKADYSWLLLSILFGLFAFISRARRWVLLINPLGFNPSARNAFYAMMTGYLANIALPRIGEITRCVALGKKEKIPVDQLIGTVVIERTIDFFSLLLIMIVIDFYQRKRDRLISQRKYSHSYTARSSFNIWEHMDPLGHSLFNGYNNTGSDDKVQKQAA